MVFQLKIKIHNVISEKELQGQHQKDPCACISKIRWYIVQKKLMSKKKKHWEKTFMSP